MIVVHGGFWRTPYGADLAVPLAQDLASAGVAAWNVEYRRVGDDPEAGGGGWPETCLDVAAAVDLLATAGQEAAGGELDLTRVVALGHSAGGHLVGWLAGRTASAPGTPGAEPAVPITGFVSQAGVLDLALAHAENLGAGAAEQFLGPDSSPADRALASPIERLPSGVPSVCVHGTADDVVPINQSEHFQAAATRAGDRCQLVTLPGVDHMAVADVTAPAWASCRTAVLELLGQDSATR